MTIAWRSTLDDVDAALLTASDVDAQVGGQVRAELYRAGVRYDEPFPPLPAPDTASVLVESAEHIAWRAAMTEALEELDEIAAAGDGDPPTVIGGDLDAARATILARLEALVGGAEPASSLAEKALDARLPREPQFYVAEYYVRWPADRRDHDRRQAGVLEAELIAEIAEADAWLDVA
jgi:hypothetical protein